ncbi:MAG: malto-oligosyltrehalose synthase [Phycisphaeraceae bacterium]|nr:malto-oligosyltrehalose synthase [Phycisphaeraceae bacterium]
MTVPGATYRLQLTPSFGFADAAAVVPYLTDLGVSHLYLSPIFEAVPGSTHGYDQTDPTRIRAELGGASQFEQLVRIARSRNLGIIIDIVPNHMATHFANPWWRGLLAEGKGSRFDKFFEVAWSAADDKVVLPVLGKPLDEAIASDELKVESVQGVPVLRYFDRFFPLREGTISGTLESLRGEALAKILDRQHYRLEYWRTGLEKINYRRFFDIADLAGVRMENPDVFEELHAGVFALVRAGQIDGVRVDHVDGLADPHDYCLHLRQRLLEISPRGAQPWVLIEKILGVSEQVPEDWQVDGTTGYEFLAEATRLQVDREGFEKLRADAVSVGAAPEHFEALRVQCKAAAAELFRTEVMRIVELARDALHAADRRMDEATIRRGLISICSQLRIYRTYGDERGMSGADAGFVDAAVARASEGASETEANALRELGTLWTLRPPFDSGGARRAALKFLIPWQQLTGPIAAKGVEDTALYRDMSMPALNDVGCEPELMDAAPSRFFADRARHSPRALNATATHDTKRGEDTRARIAALSHLSDLVVETFRAARAALEPRLAQLPEGIAPNPTDVMLILHTTAALISLEQKPVPELVDRIKAYVRKASKEAKLRTSWLDPVEVYEKACDQFIDKLARSSECRGVRESLRSLARETRGRAGLQSLAGVLLKALGPGVPDFYQGCECQDLSLVDPDNRRPVDWPEHRNRLSRITSAWSGDWTSFARAALANPDSDDAKMLVTWRALAIRRWLLDAGESIAVSDLEADGSRLFWRFVSGPNSGSVTVVFESRQVRSDAGRTISAFDQLTGASRSSDASGVLVVVDGAERLIGAVSPDSR